MSRAALTFVTRTLGADAALAQPSLAQPSLDMDDTAWTQIIEFANQHLLTPALYGALNRQGRIAELAPEVAGYLAHLADANSSRNRMMYDQGIELATHLNAAGMVPMFLKSAADLMEGAAVLASDGIVGDLDVLVPPDAGADAVAALANAGYRSWGGLEPNDHTYADLGREQDAALIDLHTEVLELGHLLPSAEMYAGAVTVARGGARFCLPAPENRVLHRLIHDQIQGRGLYTGRLHLGHAWRTAWMLRQQVGVDWADVARRASRNGLSTALRVEMFGAGLFGTEMPSALTGMLAATMVPARALHRWRMIRLTHPRVGIPGDGFARVIDLYTRMRFIARDARARR